LANAAIAASRVASWPCVGVRSSCCPKASVHIHGVPTGAAFALKDAADHDAVREHVVIVVVPFAGRA
jgi:hypothetical protein